MVTSAIAESRSESAMMKAALQLGIRQYGVSEVRRPAAAPGTAVAKVVLAGVCGSDLHRYFQRPEPQSLPEGHEMVGIVAEVGEGVDRVKLGDRVVIDLITLGRGCGVCDYCRSGNHVHCQDPGRPPLSGALSEYVVAKAEGFFRVPDHVDDRAAVLVEPVAVGIHAGRWSGFRRGATAVVLGAGTIGLATMLALQHLGAERVYITAKHPFQAEMAHKLGATAVLPIDPDAADEAVKAATEGIGADYVFETVGGNGNASNTTMDLACRMVRRQGKVVMEGVFFDGLVTMDLFHPLLKETTIYMPDCYSAVDGRHDFEMAVEVVAQKPELIRQMVTHEFSLDEATRAFATAADKSSGSIKVLVRP